ncbi:DUF3180 family protein [Nocardioides sp. HDW12B]|nr:DUF3180 family protein [Nocardioides sp. HDW12B]
MLGWSVRAVATRLGLTVPTVTWLQVIGLAVGAGIVALTARHTRRAVRRRTGDLRPHEAVNRLVLGKACALVGALVAGGYVGAAISWVGALSERADDNVVRSAVAALAGAALMAAGLLLERACRTGDEPPPS